mmetsp:Transcript_5396/g.15027  ORF Transcript_5396/g.15027 Transcript_5396/m.15027 type:complete len:272 (+) Transcript_5396:1287-2102(+)
MTPRLSVCRSSSTTLLERQPGMMRRGQTATAGIARQGCRFKPCGAASRSSHWRAATTSQTQRFGSLPARWKAMLTLVQPHTLMLPRGRRTCSWCAPTSGFTTCWRRFSTGSFCRSARTGGLWRRISLPPWTKTETGSSTCRSYRPCCRRRTPPTCERCSSWRGPRMGGSACRSFSTCFVRSRQTASSFTLCMAAPSSEARGRRQTWKPVVDPNHRINTPASGRDWESCRYQPCHLDVGRKLQLIQGRRSIIVYYCAWILIVLHESDTIDSV